MRIPNTIKVGAHTYTITRAPLDGKVGETNSCDCTITLNDDLKDSVLGATFIHEIIHACNSTLGDTAMGHALIDSLSEQLYQVLSDNHLLADEILPLTNTV